VITLGKTLEILEKDGNFREIIIGGEYFHDSPRSLTFEKLSYDSRDVTNSTLFFAKGLAFKAEYLSGLAAPFYVSEIDYGVETPVIMVNNVKRAMSLLAMEFFGNPQDKLKIVGFTGTKGKTTAAYFAKHILDSSTKNRTALLSTMNTTLDSVHYFKSTLTTPESLDLFAMMATAVANSMTHLVMEVSSQAYKTARVYGLRFDVGVFLNLSPDHVGPIEHPTFEDYFYHKRMLMENSDFVVVNSEMMHFGLVKSEIGQNPAIYYGEKSDNRIVESSASSFSTMGDVAGKFDIKLLGRFNQENALAAALASQHLGASLADITSGIAQTTVPGRMELLTQTNGAKVFIDYAHNRLSLSNLIDVVTEHHLGDVTLILGAPGNKGESRRRDFGELLEARPRIRVILTSDDPNQENPEEIADQIARHISRPVRKIMDRETAIKTALSETAGSSDAVIIAGKGADAYQIIQGAYAEYAGDVAVAQVYL
jgi:UDP-N-acetylmuramoyl-L-alanyl-D-glutamate-L-lysine ligase